MTKKYIIALIAVVVVVVAGILFARTPQRSSSQKVKITASFYPLAFFAQEIGGEFVEVTNITPSGAEPHDYELSPQDVVALESSEVVVLNGANLEAWGDKVNGIINEKKTVVVVAGEGLATQKRMQEGSAEQTTDPHVWLSPRLAQQMSAKIESALESKDPAHAVQYKANLQAFSARIDQLDARFKNELAQCKKHDIITSHAAFGYLSFAYGFRQIPIAGLSPDAEPSPSQLANIANFAKKSGMKYIFFESLVSPKLADTIAHEIGAQTLVLNPLEGLTKDEAAQGKNYFTEMEKNLEQLKIALGCQ